jgi:hypothetical protein
MAGSRRIRRGRAGGNRVRVGKTVHPVDRREAGANDVAINILYCGALKRAA